MATSSVAGRKVRPKPQPSSSRTVSPATDDSWSPPDFAGSRRTRIGASVVEQFVAGHDPSDVLRELVQNEFDGGGNQLIVKFGADALDVIGNGRGISNEGWTRLNVIVGTGRVVGDADTERVEAKRNGIGSKNFGLRSLFIFGNEIFVRSGGQVAVLDLCTLETGRVRDSAPRMPGVRLRVPFRTQTFEMLECFTVEREQRAFDMMAQEMLATLVKLALAGRQKGLRKLTLTSSRTGNVLDWRQDAERVPCRAPGVSATRRKGALIRTAPGLEPVRRRFEEIEFARAVDIPHQFRGRSYPAYFSAGPTRLRIAVSLPLLRRKIDQGRPGHHYYPLQAPHARTGTTVSVSAPFELNSDRSDILENDWNSWLADEAAALAVHLLRGDWFDRFGADAYEAVTPSSAVRNNQFAEKILRLLSEEACWPTRATGQLRFAEAASLTTPAEPALDGFLDHQHSLHSSFEANANAKRLALRCGVKAFTISSLIKLRCGAKGAVLLTKLSDTEADYGFTDYDAAMRNEKRQASMAVAITAVAKRLNNHHRRDLGSTSSTLTAKLTLRPAEQLIKVDPAIWDVCPEPLENRLHPALVDCRPIAVQSRQFNEEEWIVDACERAQNGEITPAERAAVYAKLIADAGRLGRKAISAMRVSPIAKNHRGEWSSPSDMVALRGSTARLLGPFLSLPSKELMGRRDVMARLRLRDRLNRADLVQCATRISERPQVADGFARLLSENLNLVTASFADEVEGVSFLRTRSRGLAAPEMLHLDTPTNRLCIEDDRIVGNHHQKLFKKLRIREHPDVETLIERIEEAKEQSEPPARPDLLYPALVAALVRERRSKKEFCAEEILWVNGSYHAPDDVLVGTLIPHLFDEAIPVLRGTDAVAQAYLALGAHGHAQDEHWTAFFEHVSVEWADGELLSRPRKNALLDAYRIRGASGLPDAVGERSNCLLDRNGGLNCLADVKSNLLVEGDHPALAAALEAAHSSIMIVELNDRSRPFYSALGIRPLTAVAGTGKAVPGRISASPLWFKPQHRERLLVLLRRPLFAKAVHAVAATQRHLLQGYSPIDLNEVDRRLSSISDVEFFSDISREYTLGGKAVRISIETAVHNGMIGFVAPKTKLDFQQLVAQALAELTGAENVTQIRSLSASFLYLVLCRSNEDIRVYLERMGVNHQAWDGPDESDPSEFADTEDDTEDIIRQVFEGLDDDSDSVQSDDETSIRMKGENDEGETETPQSPEPPSPPPPFVLPDLEKVDLSIVETSGQHFKPTRTPIASRNSGTGEWKPRTPDEAARDAQVGRRGEHLIYRLELERVRSMGHADPENFVTWTSSANPGADYDIKSIDASGHPRWIEVKSTTGVDGRFEWSKKEFQKALRERESYELWRVYKAASTTPVTKCFKNPAELVGASKLVLELGSLRATIEGMD